MGMLLKKLMELNLIPLSPTPPYGISYRSNHRKVKYKNIEHDNTFDKLIWASNLEARHSKYVFTRWDVVQEMPRPKNVIHWIKNNWSMGDLKHAHALQTEQIAFYPGPDHFFPTKRPTDIVYANRTGNKVHPTQKPVELLEQIVAWTDGIVFDPFMGSGSTAVACINLGRPFIGVEIDEAYFQTAVNEVTKAHENKNRTL